MRLLTDFLPLAHALSMSMLFFFLFFSLLNIIYSLILWDLISSIMDDIVLTQDILRTLIRNSETLFYADVGMLFIHVYSCENSLT